MFGTLVVSSAQRISHTDSSSDSHTHGNLQDSHNKAINRCNTHAGKQSLSQLTI